jgi:putative copper export protein
MSPFLVLEWLLLAAYTVLCGGLLAEWLLLLPARSAPLRDASDTARMRLFSWALIVAFLASALVFVTRSGSPLRFADNRWLYLTVARLVLLILLLNLLRRRAHGSPLALLAAVVLLATQSALSRSALPQAGALQLAGDVLHLLLSSVWLGGVAWLTIVAAALSTPAPDLPNRYRAYSAAIERFSPIAVFCVSALIIGGIAQAAAYIPDLTSLSTDAFGRALLAKLAVIAVLLAFGAYHQFLLAPRLRRAALLPGAGSDANVMAAFRRSLHAEALSGAALLGAVILMKAADVVFAPI